MVNGLDSYCTSRKSLKHAERSRGNLSKNRNALKLTYAFKDYYKLRKLDS